MSDLLTRAERTRYEETSRHADVLDFTDQLCAASKRVRRTTLGQSGEGQDMVALVLSNDRCFDPARARKKKKPVVMIEANIHAGEVEGKEASLALARDLALTKLGDQILERITLVIVPDFNPDGNDRISPNNRRLDLANLEGQVNPPGGVGTRYTGEGWNLNRDNTKQEAVETRNLAAFYQAWWPELFIDCHTTDGSIHGFDLTYDTSRGNEALFSELRAASRKMLERVSDTVQKRHGFRSHWYGNYVREDDPTSGWHTYPALPRFGSHYRGLLGRMDVLLETYSYIDFPRRCAVTRAWLYELLRWSAGHSERLRRLTARAEAETIERGRAPDPRVLVGIHHGVAKRDAQGSLHFDYPAHALDGDTAEIYAFDRESIAARKYPGAKPKTYRVPHHRSFVPVVTVTTPLGYLVPASLAQRLSSHGIEHTPLDQARSYQVDSYRIVHQEQTFSPDVAALVPAPGEAEVPLSAKAPPRRFETVLKVLPERSERVFPEGTLVVKTAQRAGTLAVMLLEPESEDGLARWQLLDPLETGGLFPIHRIVSVEPVAPKKAE